MGKKEQGLKKIIGILSQDWDKICVPNQYFSMSTKLDPHQRKL